MTAFFNDYFIIDLNCPEDNNHQLLEFASRIMVVLDMDKDGKDEILLSNSWGENGKIFAFNHKAQSVGKLTELERNVETLKSQIAQFKRPAYQTRPRDVEIISRRPGNREYQHLRFIRGMALSQKFENRDELLSVSDVCLGMKSPPSDVYIRHGINGHNYRYPHDDHSSMVFDRLDCYWGGAPLPPHDFSYYGLGVQRRMCNFLPNLPYGIIPIVPDDSDLTNSRFSRKLTTDGQYFYDEHGQRREAAEYQQVAETALQKAADTLLVRVTGDVHWSAVRVDPSHVRVTLVDPGYLTPSDRNADILLQRLDGTNCVDILSGETLPIENNRIRVHVPIGIVRILDITHH